MARTSIGVIGCGTIAQIQHLPSLAELEEEFEVSIVCDISAKAAEYVARRFHVPRHVTDYRRVLDSDLDAVLLCHADPKFEVAMAAFDAGKHVFIEKPMCQSLEQADALIAAAGKAGTQGQVGYMKLFEPAFEMAQGEVAGMEDVRFVQINHLHPSNELHVAQYRTKRFHDVPAEAIDKGRAAKDAAVTEAIGEVSPEVRRVFSLLSGSMIHGLYGPRVLFGLPIRVVSTEAWRDGRAFTTTLEYGSGARCVATWVDLPDLWDFRETLEVFGDTKRVIVSYPTGFSRGMARLTISGIDSAGVTYTKQPKIPWDIPFKRELKHFHQSINGTVSNRASVASARDDIELIIAITKAYMNRAPVKL